MARKKKILERKRFTRLQIYLTQEEYKKIKEIAKKNNLSASNLTRNIW